MFQGTCRCLHARSSARPSKQMLVAPGALFLYSIPCTRESLPAPPTFSSSTSPRQVCSPNLDLRLTSILTVPGREQPPRIQYWRTLRKYRAPHVSYDSESLQIASLTRRRVCRSPDLPAILLSRPRATLVSPKSSTSATSPAPCARRRTRSIPAPSA